MTDQEKKVLSLGGRNKLELKKPAGVAPGADPGGAGSVRQSFSHGRSKTVAVEVKQRKRIVDKEPEAAGKQTMVAGPEAGTSVSVNERGRATSAVIRQLTTEERDARARALRGATVESETRAEAIAQNEQTTAILNAAGGDPLRAKEMEELRRIQEQEKTDTERRRSEGEARSGNMRAGRPEATDRMRAATARPGDAATPKTPVALKRGTNEEEDEGANRRRKGSIGRTPTPRRTAPTIERRAGTKITLTQALTSEEGAGRMRSMASMRRRIEREKRQAMAQQEPTKIARDVTIPEAITVQELSNRMAERAVDVIKVLMKLGVMATITQAIDADTAELVAAELGHRVRRVADSDVETVLTGAVDAPETMKPRPPVVTVMGHVDHGKTSLLDALRKTTVAAGEDGGITQHIGAYQVILPQAVHGFDRVTFIDTPGHSAFSEMRARGAQVTDLVILVVAADDGIMPQTIEAISHAKAANVPMLIAINKMDLPGANPMRVKTELLQHNVQVEDLGGDVLSVEISAKTGKGLDKLLELILLQAEILNLRANPDRPAEGAVVESKLEKGRGAVATVLVRRGTLKVGDIFVAGGESGRVRALINDLGQNVQSAPPAMPVEVLGLNGAPMAGDEMMVVESEAKAREISEFRQRRKRTVAATAAQRGTLEQMMENIKAGQAKELAVLIKGDVHGSVEAIKSALIKLTAENTEVRVRVLGAEVGAITESDITLAKASQAMLIGFNVRANAQAREMAKRDAVEIRYYSIIYNVIDDVRAALTGLLAPTLREKFLGNAQILQVFNITKVGKIAGCRVTEGLVKRGAKVRLLRDSVVIHEGSLKTLKRVKDEVKEVREGLECGMAFENYDNIEANDVIECFELEEVARTL
jgi:translation initiation factor IF-2